MPRTRIRRDRSGGSTQLQPRGGVSRICVANVTYPAGLHTAVQNHQDLIWSTATGATSLHQSSNVGGKSKKGGKKSGLPHNAIGYIHSYSDNLLLLVKRLDTNRNTIELVGDVGKVNAGKHVF